MRGPCLKTGNHAGLNVLLGGQTSIASTVNNRIGAKGYILLWPRRGSGIWVNSDSSVFDTLTTIRNGCYL